jgi:hypothetical protein
MKDVFIGNGELDGKGVYANKDFKRGDVIIKYHLRTLISKDFQKLSKKEKLFVHSRKGVWYLYSEPERYVNHSSKPNTRQDFKKDCDVASRKIKRGEMITTNSFKDDIA